MSPSAPLRLAIPTLAILALLTACAGKEEEDATGGGRTYTVRGQVTQLPDPANPGSGIYISHEAIDDYVGRSGEVEGMDSMNMPFPVGAGVSLEGIQPADVVEFDLHVDWESERPVEITRIRELPASTKLDFRAAEPDKNQKP
ncbi:MAG TPA: copper-binding protein [Thermoanaerobaculia bacterium]